MYTYSQSDTVLVTWKKEEKKTNKNNNKKPTYIIYSLETRILSNCKFIIESHLENSIKFIIWAMYKWHVQYSLFSGHVCVWMKQLSFSKLCSIYAKCMSHWTNDVSNNSISSDTYLFMNNWTFIFWKEKQKALSISSVRGYKLGLNKNISRSGGQGEARVQDLGTIYTACTLYVQLDSIDTREYEVICIMFSKGKCHPEYDILQGGGGGVGANFRKCRLPVYISQFHQK